MFYCRLLEEHPGYNRSRHLYDCIWRSEEVLDNGTGGPIRRNYASAEGTEFQSGRSRVYPLAIHPYGREPSYWSTSNYM